MIPPGYFEHLDKALGERPLDCFGGPDAAHDSFTPTQKAINHSMTSFLTTGGIRGGKISLEKFTPRTFNMGYSRKVYERIGGFREMFSEDIDMSTRIRNAGFSIGLIHDAPVYHKRRVDFRKFMRQVYVFGNVAYHTVSSVSRLAQTRALAPAVAVAGGITLFLLGILVSPWFLLPLALYLLAIWVAALVSTHSVKIATLAVPASIIQQGDTDVVSLRHTLQRYCSAAGVISRKKSTCAAANSRVSACR